MANDDEHRTIGRYDRETFDPTAGENASFVYTWTGDLLTRIEKTVGEKTFRRDLTWSGDNLITMSTWTEV